MASYKIHLLSGIVVGGVAAYASLTTLPHLRLETVAMIGFSGLTGSLLPDLDADNSIPLLILFEALGLFAAGLGVGHAYLTQKHLMDWFIYGLVGYLVVGHVLRYIFKRSTKHRGMFHSLPAMIIAADVYALIQIFVLNDRQGALYVGLACSAGFLIHLLLDELASMVNVKSRSLGAARSLGTAFKIRSKNRRANLITWALMIGFSLFVLYV